MALFSNTIKIEASVIFNYLRYYNIAALKVQPKTKHYCHNNVVIVVIVLFVAPIALNALQLHINA